VDVICYFYKVLEERFSVTSNENMKDIQIILFLLIAFFLNACQHHKKLHEECNDLLIVPVNITQNYPVKLSELADSLIPIKLQTKDECLIGRINQVEYCDNHIFVTDYKSRQIHAFNKDGKFLNQIGRIGQGPGEYTSTHSITIDNKNKFLYVSSNTKIIRYDFSGRFMGELSSVLWPEYIRCYDEELYIFSMQFAIETGKDGIYENRTVLFKMNKEWMVTDSIIINRLELKSQTASIMPRMEYLSCDENDIYIYYPAHITSVEPITTTMYTLKEDTLRPYIKLNLSDENKNAKNKVMVSIFRTPKHIISRYQSLNKPLGVYNFICYDMETKQARHMEDGFYDDICNTGLVEIRSFTNKKYFYFHKEAKIDENSLIEYNPIVYIGTFK